MKKLFSLMLLLAMIFTVTACGGDDKDEPSSSLSGTTWTATFRSKDVWVLDFTSKTSVTAFRSDANLNIKGDAVVGNYSISGSNLVFTNTSITDFYKYVIEKATLSGESMIVTFHASYYTGGESDSETMTFRKK